MKLNKKGKDELSRKIEKELEEVPVGQRVHLDKELLESLLFETYTEKLGNIWGENSGKNVKVKYLIWSGAFLSKIDLSEVSFDDVMWNLTYNYNRNVIDGSQNHYKGIQSIDLSGTNARIDFSKSFAGKYINNAENSLDFSYCNFSGVDLSNNVIDCNCYINKCNFSNTNINLNLNGQHSIKICCSDMSGNDFSQYTVDEEFFSEIVQICNFTNTGLKIIFTPIPREILDAVNKFLSEQASQFDYEKSHCKRGDYDYVTIFKAQQNLFDVIKNGYLNGCYINGKKILSEEEKQAVIQEKLMEYEQYKKAIFDSVFASIDEYKRKLKETK